MQQITPWDVKGGTDGKIDYNKLSREVGAEFLWAETLLDEVKWVSGAGPDSGWHAGLQFGCSTLNDELVARIERLTGQKAHPLLRRGLFYAHRDLKEILDAYEKGEPFYLYTGRVRHCMPPLDLFFSPTALH